jgi:hypothetical protein
LVKIVELLTEMQNRSQDLLYASDVEYTSASAVCANTTAAETAKVDEFTLQVQNLQASIDTLTVEISQLETDGMQYNADAVLLRRQLEAAREEHVNATTAFEQNLASFDNALSAVENTMQILQRAQEANVNLQSASQSSSSSLSSSFLQSSARLPNLVAALQAAARGMAKARAHRQSLSYQPDSGGISRDEHIFDDFGGLTTISSSYEFSSSSVESVLEQLKASFQADKDALLQQRQSSLTTFQASEQSMLLQTHTAQDNVQSTQELLVEKRTSLMTASTDLADTIAVLNSTSAYLAEVQQACAQRSQDYQELRSVRLNEISALSKAIELLSISSSPAGPAAAALLRLRGHIVASLPSATPAAAKGLLRRVSSASSKEVAATLALARVCKEKLGKLLRSEASRLESGALASLASRLSSSVSSSNPSQRVSFSVGSLLEASSRSGKRHEERARQAKAASGAKRHEQGLRTADSDDPLAKVRLMIHDLIVKLQQQATQEADHKSYCDTELGRNQAALDDATADIDKHSAQETQLDSSIATLDVEIAELNATLEQALLDRPTMVAQRQNESAANQAIIEDANMSAVAVEAAIEVLQEFYESATGSRVASASFAQGTFLVEGQDGGAQHPGQRQRQRPPARASSLVVGRSQALRHSQVPNAITETTVHGPQLKESFGVISILQILLDDYVRIMRETELKESDATRAGVDLLRSHDVMFAGAEREYQNKLQMRATYELEVEDTKTDLNSSHIALAAAEEIREQLRPPCLDVETYEEKKARREQEINALNEAYDMVVAYEQDFASAASMVGAAGAGAVLLQDPLQEQNEEDFFTGTLQRLELELSATARTRTGADAVTSSQAKAQNFLPTELEAKADVSLAQASDFALRQSLGNASNLTTSGTLNVSDVQSVIELLVGIRSDVEADLAQDTLVYENLTHWCAATISEKQTVLAAEADHDSQLVTLISTSTSEKARLTVEIDQLHAELGKDQESLAQQYEIRSREAEAFHESEKQLLESIQALSHALVVLSGHYNETEPVFNASEEQARLEEEKTAIYTGTNLSVQLLSVAGDVKKALKALPAGEVSLPSYSAEDSTILQTFLTDPGELLLRSDGQRARATLTQFGAKVNGDEGGHQIFGILEQLKETFESDLQSARDHETKSISNFEALRDSKQNAIQTLEESITIKQVQLAQHTATHASAQEDLVYVRESSKADFQHLLAVQSQCTEGKHEFKIRNSTRHSELASLDEAIDILTAGQGASFPTSVSVGSSSFLLHGRTGRIFVRHHRRRPAFLTPFPVASLRTLTSQAQAEAQEAHGFFKPGAGQEEVAHRPRLSMRLGVAGRARSLRGQAPVLLTEMPSTRQKSTPHGSSPIRAVAVRRHDNGQARTALTELSQEHGAEPLSGEALNAELSTAINTVVAQIDNVRLALEEEKGLEVRMKDTCVSERHQAEQQLERRRTDESEFNISLQRLNGDSTSISSELNEVGQQISELNQSLVTSGNERRDEYEDFGNSVRRQEEHQALLYRALQALNRFYGQSQSLISGRSSVRQSHTAPAQITLFQGPAKTQRKSAMSLPAVALASHGKTPWWNLDLANASSVNTSATMSANASSLNLPSDATYARDPGSAPRFARPLAPHGSNTGAIAIIEMLIEESEKMLEAVARAEEESRANYASGVDAISHALAEKHRQTISLQDAKGNLLLDIQNTVAARDACQAEMAEINTFLGILDTKCTYLVANFLASQQARANEILSMKQAKAALLGMVSSSLLAVASHVAAGVTSVGAGA